MNSDSAKSGFKTFILTLSVSLIVFSVVYYLVSNSNTDSESAPYQASSVTVTVEETPENVLAAETSAVVEEPVSPEVTIVEEEDSTLFGGIADKPLLKADTGSAAVLAGATSSPTDESTTTGGTVPETGLVGITAGLLVSLVFFLTGMYYISSNPRKVALSGFEKKILKDN